MEVWRDVTGYEGFYQVSDEGRVRSLWRLLPHAVKAGVRKPKLILKYGSNNQGRQQVTLSRDGESRRFQVHRLVLAAFSGPCPDGLEGLHGDGDHTNNRISNLRWGTHAENMQDMVKHKQSTRGERAGKSSLTEQDVRDIRASKETNRDAGALYNVSNVTIHAIRTRKTWKHV
jgi:HNH endonuclease/NUMOD4 motif